MVRCKFRCDSKREFVGYPPGGKTLYDYQFSAVMGNSSDTDENKKFWKYTPSGQVNVTTVTDGTFEVGREYYLDFNPAL